MSVGPPKLRGISLPAFLDLSRFLGLDHFCGKKVLFLPKFTQEVRYSSFGTWGEEL